MFASEVQFGNITCHQEKNKFGENDVKLWMLTNMQTNLLLDAGSGIETTKILLVTA